jgi:hypothetical protein
MNITDVDYYAAQSESVLVADCLEWLLAMGCLAWRQNAGMIRKGNHMIRQGPKGISDIIGCTPTGRFLAVECKRRGRKVTADQQLYLERIRGCDGIGLVVYSLGELVEQISGK